MDMTLQKLHSADAEKLFAFELNNRIFLKKWYQLEGTNTITLNSFKVVLNPC